MRTNTSRYEPPKLTTCDKCGLHYYLTNAPHVCAEWTTGQPRTSGVETEAGSTAASKWQVERLPIHGWRILNENGSELVRDIYNEEIAKQVVSEHNQHAALVAERERLRASLRLIRSMLVYTDDLTRIDPIREQLQQAKIEIDDALASTEQGGERR